ncbi:hypothetical protein BABINDRAFT_179155 [Babjeviella inositovora NRRL Y-12698]|uniref:Maintenance of ploidy protein mob1 n=1 Tax=Babjeviella inositovora NRRL Y-12698 TaxID=984486 RepID=A0A1E3R015_9ASCO|nr:uncharacterized protein BABINDRAFT_179155 [Babjeviella inositovora NRRL Y-12698]ODQ83233.1 hypothetical protein BABINDRAFT_179155 [Babjeviella inositovora NRRL Y-12698]
MSFFQNLNTHTLKTTRAFKNPHAQDAYLQNELSESRSAAYPSYSSHNKIRSYAEQSLGSDSALQQAVKLPRDESLQEWYAVHVVDFYNQLNMLYGSITEFCSPETCPRMLATQEYEYLWQDPPANSKPYPLPAPQYIEKLMSWCQQNFDDENVFPAKMGQPFPSSFDTLVKTMFKRLFRVYAHIYCHHFDEIRELGLGSHLNTSLKHFVVFVEEFGLIKSRDYGPLEELCKGMLGQM